MVFSPQNLQKTFTLVHLRLVIFLGELNNLELWGSDIGNAYLEAHTHETLFLIGGAESGELEGFILILNKALYGLESSGKNWQKILCHCQRHGIHTFLSRSMCLDEGKQSSEVL